MPIGLFISLICLASGVVISIRAGNYFYFIPFLGASVILTLISMKVDGWKLRGFKIKWNQEEEDNAK